MNKRISSLLLLAPALALLALPAAAAPLHYHTEAKLPAHAGGTVEIRLGSEDLDVNIVSGSQVTMTVDVRGDISREDAIKRYVPEFKANGNDISVRAPERHGWSNWSLFGHDIEARVTVNLPAGMNVDFNTGSGDTRFRGDTQKMEVRGETGSGDVDFRGAARRISMESGSGDQTLRLTAAAERVELQAGSGTLRIAGSAAQLRSETGSGDVDADDLTGAVDLRAGSGDISARWANGPTAAAVTIRTGSGDVRVHLPAGAQLAGVVESNGGISSEFPGKKEDDGDRLIFNGPAGSIPVRIHTGSGDVEILKN
ncbi:MAG TPA: DUF4097 family beta strand repeat-containing protein [Gammaproteobacteria bacterium]|jgi:DUF4097 and DUF4098 domain-containing protein YvlB|nr:DUF4097 family beta strand repeat-containing protein [Gammaproteobacteria bacterium]